MEIKQEVTATDGGKRKRLRALAMAAAVCTAGLAVGAGGRLLLASCANEGTSYVAAGQSTPVSVPCAGAPNAPCLISFKIWAGHSVCNGTATGDNCVVSSNGGYELQTWTGNGCDVGEYGNTCYPALEQTTYPPTYIEQSCGGG
jgi:hypothetical protein